MSPSLASFTVIAHSESSRAANAAVNFSGMCWTMTMPGASAAARASNARSASVPPVDAPIATTRSVVWSIAREAGGASTASAVSFWLHQRRGGSRRAAVPGARAPPP